MKFSLASQIRTFALLWSVGSLALTAVAAVSFWLDANFATTALLFIIVIVLLSLMDSLISSALFSIIAVVLLNYVFTEPRFSFRVELEQDIVALAAFMITSLAITGLVRRLRELGERQREQTRLLNLSHDSILACDPAEVITYWSEGAERLYGWKPEEALGKLPHQLLQTAFPVPREQITKTLFANDRWEGELVQTRRDGCQIIVASRWSLHRDENGQLLGTLETNTDITQRKRAEDALRRTQDTFLAEAQELSHTGSFGWNVASGEIFWSEQSFRIFECDRQLVPSLELVLQRVHPDDHALVKDIIDDAAANHKDFDFEHRLLMPDGAVKHIHVVAHAMNGAPGRLQFMGAMMDITDRKMTEEALRSSEQRYRHLFHQMPIGMWQLNTRDVAELIRSLRDDGVGDIAAYLDQHPHFLMQIMDNLMVEEVNEHAIKMFGAHDRLEMLGPVSPYWRNNPDTFRRAIASWLHGEQHFREETRFLTFDGRYIDALFSSARLNPASQRGISLVGIIEITERVRAEERLRELQSEFAHAARVSVLGELTASIAHEINQPLAAMLTNGETALRWLSRPEPDLAKVGDLLRRITDDGRRAASIVSRIREMAAGLGPQSAALSLHDVITNSMIFLRHELHSSGVDVSIDLEPSLPQIFGDRIQLQQVVVNLTVNAAQAMTQAGSLRRMLLIQARVADRETLCCSFEDSGPGIDPSHVDRLFGRFFTTKDTGMGMGLPISRSIIEAHGGQIWVDNESIYGGAKFTFLLPIAARTSKTA